jgi:DNA-binding NarL/FixJ family response regulator
MEMEGVPTTGPEPPVGFLLSDDMIFTSRIVGTGRDLGVNIKPTKTADDLLALAGQQTPRCVIVDLSNAGLKITEFMKHLAENCSPRPFVVAYGSHVDTATLRAGRDAGCDLVWPRSKFVEELPRVMRDWFAQSPGS